MKLGTQVKSRGDMDFRMWAQLGVRHLCADPEGNPHSWTQDALDQHVAHVGSFGLSVDMVELPLSSRPIEESASPHILQGKSPERDREIDSICRLIEMVAKAGIPAVKYNLNIIGIPRTPDFIGRGGSRNAAFYWKDAQQDAPPGLAGLVRAARADSLPFPPQAPRSWRAPNPGRTESSPCPADNCMRSVLNLESHGSAAATQHQPDGHVVVPRCPLGYARAVTAASD